MNDLIRRQSKRYILTKKIADSVPFISRFLAEIEWAPLKSLFWNTNDLLWLISSSLGHYYNSIAKLTISMQAAFDCDTNLVIKIC